MTSKDTTKASIKQKGIAAVKDGEWAGAAVDDAIAERCGLCRNHRRRLINYAGMGLQADGQRNGFKACWAMRCRSVIRSICVMER